MTNKIYFKNFDALRGIAALSVLIGHIELHKPSHGLLRFETFNLLPLGGIAVTLFFVLSGFLISYLLLNEFTLNGKLNIKHFYLRRILKIWPLYFGVLLVGYFIWGDLVQVKDWLYCIFFLPNVAFLNNALPNMIDPIWSIGVEEQFYLFFPILFFLNHVKRIFYSIIALLAILLSLKAYSLLGDVEWLRDYLYLARYDCMLIGSLSAFVLYYHKQDKELFTRIIKLTYTKVVQISTYVLLIIYFIMVLYYDIEVIHQVFAVLFALILLNLGTNESSLLSLESKILNRIGVISYGIYLSHKFTNYIVLEYIHVDSGVIQNILTYTLSIGLSIIVATISYYAFEIHFIKLKKRFAIFEK